MTQDSEVEPQSPVVSRETTIAQLDWCPKCRVRVKLKDPRKGYCAHCYRAARANWERANLLAGEARKRQLTRAKSHVYLKRGKLQRQPCVSCGGADSEMHHPDYSSPLEVVWMCRPCHMKEHESGTPPKPVGKTKGVRRYHRGGNPLCSKCKTNPHAPKQRYCRPCKATYMREWRKSNT